MIIKEELELIKDVELGRTKSFVLEKYKINRTTFDKILNAHNINYETHQDECLDLPQQEIVQWYEQGLSLTEIALKLGHHANALLIPRILRKNKVQLREVNWDEVKEDVKHNRFTKRGLENKYSIDAKELNKNIGSFRCHLGFRKELDIEEITRLYVEEKLTTQQIGDIFNVTDHTIATRLRKNGIEVRTHGRTTNKDIDIHYFDKIDTPEKAYLIGYLFADGCVKTKGTISFDGTVDAYSLFEAIREELRITTPVKLSTRVNRKDMMYLRYHCRHIVKQLAKFNIIPNKTYEAKGLTLELIPSEFHRDYIRGLYEGDGYVSLNEKTGNVGFCSHFKETTDDFKNFLTKTLELNKNGTFKGTATYFCSWAAKQDIIKIYNYMYYSAELKLVNEYKHNRFLELLKLKKLIPRWLQANNHRRA